MASGLQPAHGGGEVTRVIRPAAVVPEASASAIMKELSLREVSRGGIWNVSSTLWQRYSGAWDGPGGTTGTAQLIGSIAVIYDRPVRHQITVYKVTITSYGASKGVTVESLTDEALRSAGLTLASCPRTELAAPPPADPFWKAPVAV